MSNKTQKLVILTTLISLIIVLGYFYFQFFLKSIYQSKTCTWTNIDNIEIHTGIDIPAIINVKCNYNKAQKIKTAVFTVDKTNVDLVDYLRANHFMKYNTTTYCKKGTTKNAAWKSSLNLKTAELQVIIKYY